MRMCFSVLNLLKHVRLSTDWVPHEALQAHTLLMGAMRVSAGFRKDGQVHITNLQFCSRICSFKWDSALKIRLQRIIYCTHIHTNSSITVLYPLPANTLRLPNLLPLPTPPPAKTVQTAPKTVVSLRRSGLLRLKCKCRSDGHVGWATSVGNAGTVFLEALVGPVGHRDRGDWGGGS